jgi:hypothetical protein
MPALLEFEKALAENVYSSSPLSIYREASPFNEIAESVKMLECF